MGEGKRPLECLAEFYPHFRPYLRRDPHVVWNPTMGCKFLAFSFLARNEKFYAISREKREKARNFLILVRIFYLKN